MKQLLGVVAALGIVIQLQGDTRRIDPATYLQHVKVLASDELEGRGDGAPGLEKAAEYIEKAFRASGLEPAGDDGTFFQAFPIITGISLSAGNTFSVTVGGSTVPFEIGRDYRIVSTSPAPPDSTPLPLVFAGYGITAQGEHYDDYAGIDAKGKAVLIFTHEPQENDARSAFDGQNNTPHSSIMRKVEVARAHGAAAIVVVDDINHRVQPDQNR